MLSVTFLFLTSKSTQLQLYRNVDNNNKMQFQADWATNVRCWNANTEANHLPDIYFVFLSRNILLLYPLNFIHFSQYIQTTCNRQSKILFHQFLIENNSFHKNVIQESRINYQSFYSTISLFTGSHFSV